MMLDSMREHLGFQTNPDAAYDAMLAEIAHEERSEDRERLRVAAALGRLSAALVRDSSALAAKARHSTTINRALRQHARELVEEFLILRTTTRTLCDQCAGSRRGW